MKRCIFLLLLLLALWPASAAAVELDIEARSALLMEKETGQVLYTKNEHEKLEPASVTKVMTLLLTMEAIDRGAIAYDDVVTVSAYAASMGGSNVYLAEGEQITVEDLLKAVCVASGNDASVALAEHVSGVTELFVAEMNNRARELGMKDTHFVNCHGLPAEGHVSSAADIAIMSRELILNHPDLRRFTTIWMDSLRGGEFQLANTNKLIRFYDGATGLKTGSTSSAGYCVSATAERDGMELIAVVLKGSTSQQRFEDAKTMLNYGFSTYALHAVEAAEPFAPLSVRLGMQETVALKLPETGRQVLVKKAQIAGLTQEVSLPETVDAPVEEGQQLGVLTVRDGETVVLEVPIQAAESVEKLTWWEMYRRMLGMLCFNG
ncbi:MAG: D-alanyl-D-alanine carboxypeptidase [Ruminococcaceae bacterium]|nr:D-alanyl-D-alanine carboxypeptidase [Oscillospiraceae bacterium]